jgi:hypothetical protein
MSQIVNQPIIETEIELNPLKDLIFKISPIPRVRNRYTPKYWVSFAYGLNNGVESTKGVIYLPNYSEGGEFEVKDLKQRINKGEYAFQWILESIIHEYLHKWLDLEIDVKTAAQLDNIDKINGLNYQISNI